MLEKHPIKLPKTKMQLAALIHFVSKVHNLRNSVAYLDLVFTCFEFYNNTLKAYIIPTLQTNKLRPRGVKT